MAVTSERRKKMADLISVLRTERARVQLALITVQLGYGIYYVLTKAAMSQGVNRFVFAVYRDAIALCLLGPLAFFSEGNLRTSLSVTICLLIAALGFTGIFLQQTLFLAGLAFTNTAFAAAMQNAIPVFTLMIAVVVKYEAIRLSKPDGVAKLVGICSAVIGAFIMCLYKGSTLLGEDRSSGMERKQEVAHGVSETGTDNGWVVSTLLGYGVDYWQVGALCLIGNCFCMGIYTNLQIPALKRFPAPVSLTASSIFVGAIALLITGLLTVSQASEWVLHTPGTIISVAYAGAVASGLNFSLQTWANQRGGPVLVAAYIPLQTVFSACLGVVILNDPVYLGTVVGAVLILVGLYLVIWGQRLHRLATETESLAVPFQDTVDDVGAPLLQNLR